MTTVMSKDVRIKESPQRRRAVVFDGDDTLWATQPLYTEAKQRFRQLASHAGINPQHAQKTLERIDLGNMRKHGFSRRRFPLSLRQAIQQLIKHPHARDLLAERAEEIGQSIFKRSPKLYEDTRKVLASLKKRGLYLILMTKGDPQIQWSRIRKLGLRRFFDAIEVVPSKSQTAYRRIVRTHRLDRSMTWVVGNSLRSDIRPALKAGLRTIWIPRYTWAYEGNATAYKRGIKPAAEHVVRSLRRVERVIANQYTNGHKREKVTRQPYRLRYIRRRIKTSKLPKIAKSTA